MHFGDINVGILAGTRVLKRYESVWQATISQSQRCFMIFITLSYLQASRISESVMQIHVGLASTEMEYSLVSPWSSRLLFSVVS